MRMSEQGQTQSRTAHSVRNVAYAVGFQLAFFVAQFILRRVFVDVLSADYLGVNGAFTSLISLLSIAELGFGTAITYSMYKPLAQDDRPTVSALVNLYKRIYRIVGIVVIAVGLAIVPFLPQIVGEISVIPHLYLVYALFLAESATSYFLVYKQSIILADQRQRVHTRVRYTVLLSVTVLQMLFLVLTQNYLAYLVLRVAGTLAINLILSNIADKMYPYIKQNKDATLDKDVKDEIAKNVKAMAAHKLGGVAVVGTDNLLIAIFVGIVDVGKYSNYYMIINGLTILYSMVFSALWGSIGNLGATEDPESIKSVFKRVNFAGCWLYGFSAICLIALFQPFIALWVGEEYLFSDAIVLLIAINFYVMGMRNPVLSFKESLGLFWPDRYKPLVEALINLVVSILLAMKFGVAGILLGTLISTMTTCFWVEPLVLYKHRLGSGLGEYFLTYLKNTLITVLAGAAVWGLCLLVPSGNLLLALLLRLVLCLIVPNAIFWIFYRKTSEYAYYIELAKRLFNKRKAQEDKASE